MRGGPLTGFLMIFSNSRDPVLNRVSCRTREKVLEGLQALKDKMNPNPTLYLTNMRKYRGRTFTNSQEKGLSLSQDLYQECLKLMKD